MTIDNTMNLYLYKVETFISIFLAMSIIIRY